MPAEPTVVYFWMVRTIQKKLETVGRLATRHFTRKERVLIITPTLQAANYVDQLLWSNPAESFLPHAISISPLEAAVVITYRDHQGTEGVEKVENPNQAQILINLCPDISKLASTVSCVHELYDQTDPEKQRLSEARYNAYEAAGFLCSKEST